MQLSTKMIRLVPVDSQIHGEAMFVCSNQNPDLHLPPFENVSTLKGMLDKLANDENLAMLAIHCDASVCSSSGHPIPIEAYLPIASSLSGSPEVLAGVVDLRANRRSGVGEMGLLLYRHARRTGISKDALALVQRLAMELPRDGGWGLRRLEWRASSWNVPSQRLAASANFTLEGILRNAGVPPTDTMGGYEGTEGDSIWPARSDDIWIYSMIIQDWLSLKDKKIES